MNNFKRNTIITILLFLVYSITFMIDFLCNQTIALTVIVICLGSLLLLYILLAKIDSKYYIGIILFTGFSTFFGQALRLYYIFPYYDLLLHLVSGILLVFLGHYLHEILLQKNKNSNIPVVFTVFFCCLFSLASAAVWEIWEFSGDVLFALTSQGGLTDTMTDMIAGTIGAVIGTFILWRVLKKEDI